MHICSVLNCSLHCHHGGKSCLMIQWRGIKPLFTPAGKHFSGASMHDDQPKGLFNNCQIWICWLLQSSLMVALMYLFCICVYFGFQHVANIINSLQMMYGSSHSHWWMCVSYFVLSGSLNRSVIEDWVYNPNIPLLCGKFSHYYASLLADRLAVSDTLIQLPISSSEWLPFS